MGNAMEVKPKFQSVQISKYTVHAGWYQENSTRHWMWMTDIVKFSSEDINFKLLWFSTMSVWQWTSRWLVMPRQWLIMTIPHLFIVHWDEGTTLLLYLPRNTIPRAPEEPMIFITEHLRANHNISLLSRLLIPDWPDSMTLTISLISLDRNDTY